METYTICDITSSEPEFLLAINVHRELSRLLVSSTCTTSKSRKNADRHMKRDNVVLFREINRLTTSVLKIAHQSRLSAISYQVEYIFELSRKKNDYVCIRPDDILDRFFGPMISSAMFLRDHSWTDQIRFVHLAATIYRMRNLEQTLEQSPEEIKEITVLYNQLERAKTKFSVEIMEAIRGLEISCLEALSNVTYCLPRIISSGDSPSDLCETARYYGVFGATLRFPYLNVMSGQANDVESTRASWKRFEGAGRALQVLGGWIRALGSKSELPLCAVCYRHVETKVRCVDHATKTHETREGRLGKRVRPRYIKQLRDIMSSYYMDSHVLDNVFSLSSSGSILYEAADASGLNHTGFRDRAVELARYLRQFRGSVNWEQAAEIENLFEKLVFRVKHFYLLPEARTHEELKYRQQTLDLLRDLLSPKGFFRCWFTGYIPAVCSIPQTLMRAHDRRHPIANGVPVDRATLQRHLLMQRAWDEAEVAYVREAMPDAAVINPLLYEGLGFSEIGNRVGLTHQSIRTNLRRPNAQRKRNRLL